MGQRNTCSLRAQTILKVIVASLTVLTVVLNVVYKIFTVLFVIARDLEN